MIIPKNASDFKDKVNSGEFITTKNFKRLNYSEPNESLAVNLNACVSNKSLESIQNEESLGNGNVSQVSGDCVKMTQFKITSNNHIVRDDGMTKPEVLNAIKKIINEGTSLGSTKELVYSNSGVITGGLIPNLSFIKGICS